MSILTQLAPSDSLVKKHLSAALFDRLKGQKTTSGFTLSHALASGIKNPDSHVGIYAGDAQSYEVFAPLLDLIIEDYHNKKAHCLTPEFSVPDLSNPDPNGTFILSTRTRLARNLTGFCFPCHMNLQERLALEKKMTAVFKTLTGSLTGKYFSFATTAADVLDRLKKEKMSFSRGDRFQDAAGFNKGFPQGRGIFHTNDKHLIIWVGEEDHLRIISMEKSADLASVFKRLSQAVTALNNRLEFAHTPKKGFLTTCPTNIGTTMRAGVHIRLSNLDKNRPLLDKLAAQHHLQIRGTGGEKTAVRKAVFDISNEWRLGLTESDIVRTLHKGLVAIIEAEKSL